MCFLYLLMTMFNGGCPAVPSNQGEEIHYDQRVTGVNGVSLSDVAVAVLRFSCHLFFSLLLHPDSIFVLISLCFVPFSLFSCWFYFCISSSTALLHYWIISPIPLQSMRFRFFQPCIQRIWTLAFTRLFPLFSFSRQKTLKYQKKKRKPRKLG